MYCTLPATIGYTKFINDVLYMTSINSGLSLLHYFFQSRFMRDQQDLNIVSYKWIENKRLDVA